MFKRVNYRTILNDQDTRVKLVCDNNFVHVYIYIFCDFRLHPYQTSSYVIFQYRSVMSTDYDVILSRVWSTTRFVVSAVREPRSIVQQMFPKHLVRCTKWMQSTVRWMIARIVSCEKSHYFPEKWPERFNSSNNRKKN